MTKNPKLAMPASIPCQKKGVEWKGTDHFIGAAVIVGICIYFIGVSFQHGYELQKEADEIL